MWPRRAAANHSYFLPWASLRSRLTTSCDTSGHWQRVNFRRILLPSLFYNIYEFLNTYRLTRPDASRRPGSRPRPSALVLREARALPGAARRSRITPKWGGQSRAYNHGGGASFGEFAIKAVRYLGYRPRSAASPSLTVSQKMLRDQLQDLGFKGEGESSASQVIRRRPPQGLLG